MDEEKILIHVRVEVRQEKGVADGAESAFNT